MTRRMFLWLVACLALLTAPAAIRQTAASGTVVEDTVPSGALKENLLGDPGESAVVVYLPPSYASSPERRYPTLYLLHGFISGFEVFGARPGTRGYQGMQLAASLDDLMHRALAREMIVVTPNGRNGYFGSFYANSSVTGRWEDFITRDLVSWIDAKYRTIPSAQSRGVAGHSMGGYGAIMLAMKHPDVFGALYALSPCCIGLEADLGADNPSWLKTMQLRTRDQLQPRPRTAEDFYPTAFIALAAALSPNTQKAPLFVDLPFRAEGGRVVPNQETYSAWRSKMPLYLINQYTDNLKKLRGIYLDYGALDPFVHIRLTTSAFSKELASRDIAHTLEVYANGDHENKIRERIETRVMRFFSEVLSFS